MAPDALLLDLDGTLVDTLGDFVHALQAMLDELAPPGAAHRLQRDEVELLVGKGSENLVHQVLARFHIPTAACAQEALEPHALAVYLAHYREVNGRYAVVYPGVVQALQAWQRDGVPMVCVTNKPTQYARALLQRTGLGGFFQDVIGGDAVARKKPDPMPLLEACARLGLAPERVWMVGDSINDAMAARAAGCPVVLVSYGYNHGLPVQQAQADAVIDTLTALLAPH